MTIQTKFNDSPTAMDSPEFYWGVRGGGWGEAHVHEGYKVKSKDSANQAEKWSWSCVDSLEMPSNLIHP